MLNIKNFGLVTEKVTDFTLSDLQFIWDLKYSIEIDTVSLFDVYNKSILDINFILNTKEKAKKYKVLIRFHNLGSLQLNAGGTAIQLTGFEILDIMDSGWESRKYLVRDFENEDDFKLYCNEIEVISIEEIELWIG
ncbi:hypothetical protein [Paenibacillus sp. FSL H7-0331]|uniref:hypothetical protein n=1 Tax=Paenibacillus sp. FSL H7-0331 TaxID=1920421 RepID=UPI00096FA8A1|nr:hypothetical protein [Paenibacillus sp. FSL H7-0331]OMF13668.1 hypothetical protein BK127_20810 [Paenibacillus sp. FSL H7-0331]